MTFKMKGFSGFKQAVSTKPPSPTKHKTISKLSHTHVEKGHDKYYKSFEGDPSPRTNIHVKDEGSSLLRPGGVNPPKKSKKKKGSGRVKRWLRKNINLRGGVRPRF